MKRRLAIASRLTGFAVLLFVALPAGLLFAPQKLRDYAYRELAYRVIVDDVTQGVTSDLQIASSLFAFIADHEFAPGNAPVVDTTVFNDLVRGIGYCDQQAWGLSTLLAKKRIPATLLMLRGRREVSAHTVAIAYLDGKWRILDPFYKQTFTTPSGELATFEELQRDPDLIRTASPKLAALARTKKPFVDEYVSLYEPGFPPTKWSPLTEAKDPVRRSISALVDGYVTVLGSHFRRPISGCLSQARASLDA